MREFNKNHGKPGEVLVCIGDFAAKYKHRLHHAPRPLRRLIKRFQEAKHTVCLVDERYTSKRCCNCQLRTANCDTFFVAPNRRPYRCDYGELHGLLVCDACDRRYNRDLNACINIFRNAAYKLVGQQPPYLSA
jgi:transposase